MEWIKVEDKLPKPTQQVTVYIPENNRVTPCTFMYKDFEVYSIMKQEWFKPHGVVTHWQPLPEASK